MGRRELLHNEGCLVGIGAWMDELMMMSWCLCFFGEFLERGKCNVTYHEMVNDFDALHTHTFLLERTDFREVPQINICEMEMVDLVCDTEAATRVQALHWWGSIPVCW